MDFENVPANIQKNFLMICAASTPIHGYFFFFILLFIFSINQCTVIAVNPQVVALSHVDRRVMQCHDIPKGLFTLFSMAQNIHVYIFIDAYCRRRR